MDEIAAFIEPRPKSVAALSNMFLEETASQETKHIFERYRIEIKEAPPKFKIPSKFLVKRYNNCVNLQECVEACIYGVHKVREDGQVAEPLSDKCRGCHACTLACPKSAISVMINPEFEKLGNSYFTPERLEAIYYEAETGRIPVSGAGYGGPFSGRGFDGIWFDFSEIVRPTRDGIHGREYISTSVDLGRKLPHLNFDERGNMISDVPKTIEIPIPIILDAPTASGAGIGLQLALAKAATTLKTFSVVNAKEYSDDLKSYMPNLIPRIGIDRLSEFEELVRKARIVEIEPEGSKIDVCIKSLKEVNPSALISIRSKYDERSGERAEVFAKEGADIIHFYVDDAIVEKDPDVVKNAIQRTHSYLVYKNIRDEVTFISGGGIAEASHVPKSIILGTDAISLGLAYQIALGCKICYGNEHSLDCQIKVEAKDVDWASQRILNLVSSWRDQLLEVLGGMGLREVRRQRGEIGRAMFCHEIEERIFGGRE